MENENKSILDRFAQRNAIPIAIVAALFIILGTVYSASAPRTGVSEFMANVDPAEGTVIPVVWGDLGKRLVTVGVIDREKFVALYGSLTNEEQKLLDGTNDSGLRVTTQNAPYLLNLFWAFGLANANPILEKGEMMRPAYGGVGGFASTGGWTLAKGNTVAHYNKHALVKLTPAQQKLVDDVSQHVYRPCCDNSTHFPDCNHGMAMLGLLELMASQGRSETEMYKAALVMNSYWFPDNYRTLAAYFASRGIAWKDVSAQEVLGKEYSSASGFARIAAMMQPQKSGGGSCGIR